MAPPPDGLFFAPQKRYHHFRCFAVDFGWGLSFEFDLFFGLNLGLRPLFLAELEKAAVSFLGLRGGWGPPLRGFYYPPLGGSFQQMMVILGP